MSARKRARRASARRRSTRRSAGLQPDPVVIARDRAQPELTQSLDDYVTARLSPKTLDRAAEVARTDAGRRSSASKTTYGVPAPIMVAIWGLESNFGAVHRRRPDIAALATLAYDGRRPALFRAELFEALTHRRSRPRRPADEFKGSWAGAMGQPQFMPSSFLKHAVDFDGDGKIDIWTSPADVFGSMAQLPQDRRLDRRASAGAARSRSRRP